MAPLARLAFPAPGCLLIFLWLLDLLPVVKIIYLVSTPSPLQKKQNRRVMLVVWCFGGNIMKMRRHDIITFILYKEIVFSKPYLQY